MTRNNWTWTTARPLTQEGPTPEQAHPDNPDLGYNAVKGEYVDMVKARIIDPLKVIRTALVDAASISSLLTTTEAIVVELPSDKETPTMGGGMAEIDYSELSYSELILE